MDLKRNPRVILAAGLLIAGTGLLLFAYLGTFNRFFADDWCYNQDFKKLGLLGSLGGYNFQTRYASNRFSLTFFSGLMYPLWVPGVRVMTGVAVGIWTWALYALITSLDRRFKLVESGAVRWLFSTLLVYFFLYLAPHPYQNLHWRAGFMPYTAPIIFGTLLAALYGRQASEDPPSRTRTVLAFVLAFFTAGFSEVSNTLTVAALGLFLLAVLAGKRMGRHRAAAMMPGAAAGLAAALLATLIMISSPAIPARMVSYSEPTPLLELPGLTLSLGLFLFEQFAMSLPVPSLIILGLGGSIGIIFVRSEKTLTIRAYTLGMLAVAGTAFLLAVASLAPSAYIEHGLPDARGLYPIRVILMIALALSAGLTGVFLRSRIQKKAFNLAATVALLFCFIYVGRSLGITAERIPIYADRAATWDRRHDQILADKARGLTEISVEGIDSKPVHGMKDLKPNPKDWVNVCAAEYYDVDRLAATLP